MDNHDRFCPLAGDVTVECVVCDAIKQARGEEKNVFSALWKENLPRVEERNYNDGYRDGMLGKPKRGSSG